MQTQKPFYFKYYLTPILDKVTAANKAEIQFK